MDPITLIVAALAAGASAGTLDALKDDVKDLVDATGTAAGKYDVTIKDSQGVQVGDRGVQVNLPA
jgi:hypothetical protein